MTPEHTHDAAPDHAGGNPDLIPLRPAAAVPRHPLDPLTATEIETARAVLVAAGLLGDTVRVPMLLPYEPDKSELAAWAPGDEMDRRVDVTLLDTATGGVVEAIVSVTRGEVVTQREHDTTTAPYGQPQYLFEEYERAAEIVKASDEWRAAMTRRGLAERIGERGETVPSGVGDDGFEAPLGGEELGDGGFGLGSIGGVRDDRTSPRGGGDLVGVRTGVRGGRPEGGRRSEGDQPLTRGHAAV